LGGGLRFGVPVTTLKINKMAILGLISLKFGICRLYTTKLCKKIFCFLGTKILEALGVAQKWAWQTLKKMKKYKKKF
jgi:hypothetical protein